MTRIPLTLTAGVAAVAAVALLATSGSAQTAAPTTLHLVEKDQKNVGFFPKHNPRQGDRFGFGSTVSGDETGNNRGICTVIGTGQALCVVQESLSKGTLTAEGLIRLRGRAHNTPFAVTGGTGAYSGARGTALVTETKTTTDVQVSLLP